MDTETATETCSKCNRSLTNVYSLGAIAGVGPSTSPDTVGFHVRGSVVCSACIMAAKTDPAAIAAARKPAPKRARRPRLSAAARAERERAIEADRIAAGGHPWAEDEM